MVGRIDGFLRHLVSQTGMYFAVWASRPTFVVFFFWFAILLHLLFVKEITLCFPKRIASPLS